MDGLLGESGHHGVVPPRACSTSKAQSVRAVAYLRVSTEKQASDGLSLDVQREKLSAYAALYEIEVVDTVGDPGASARTLERPGLRAALAMLDGGKADALLVVRLDRLSRSVRDLGDLMERYFAPGKHQLLSVSEQIDTRTAGGRLVVNVLASVFQWEREAVGERTAAAMAYKRARGEYTGGRVPFGFRLANDGVHLIPDRVAQRMATVARQLREQGLSLREVARELAAQGWARPSGRALAPIQVARMIAATEREYAASPWALARRRAQKCAREAGARSLERRPLDTGQQPGRTPE